MKKTLDTSVSPVARVAADPQPARVLSLPAFGAGAVMGAVVKPDLTSEPTSDYYPNYEAFFKSKADLVQGFMSGAPNIAEQAALFGVKYVLLNTLATTEWDFLDHYNLDRNNKNGGWGSFEPDFNDKVEGRASMRAQWHADAKGQAFIAYALPPGAPDWPAADSFKLWVKFSQGGCQDSLVGLQDGNETVAWQDFCLKQPNQWQELSFDLPFPNPPESFQGDQLKAIVIGMQDPAKAFAEVSIWVDGLRLVKKGREILVDASTEAMFIIARDNLQGRPQDFRLLAFEEGWFLFENLRFRGMAFELCSAGEGCNGTLVDYQRPDANTIHLSFDLDKPPARLLVSETYHRGWVSSDPRVKMGQEPQTRLLTLDVDQPGRYEVTLRYQPYDQFLPLVGLGWGGYLVAVAAMGLPWRRLFRGASPATAPPSGLDDGESNREPE